MPAQAREKRRREPPGEQREPPSGNPCPLGREDVKHLLRAEARDAATRPGPHPLIIFSHHSGGHRRKATFLGTHLASHGYAVAALDHSEVIAPELSDPSAERSARLKAIISSRVPDVRFLLNHLLGTGVTGLQFDPERVEVARHSFCGWTALAVPEVEPRVGAVVALGPGGGGRPKPGILPLTLAFGWDHEVPALYLAAADDTRTPLDGICEMFGRAPEPKRMFVLRLCPAARRPPAFRG